MAKSSKRHDLIRTAGTLVQEGSPEALTLDAVALRAGVSKGGLLYHFPSKAALQAGMVDAYLEEFEAAVDADAAAGPAGTGRWLRAYVRVGLSDADPRPGLDVAFLVAAGHPALLDRVRVCSARWFDRATEGGVEATTAVVVMRATDGVWFAEALGVHGVDAGLRQRVHDRLMDLIDAEVPRTAKVRGA
jgi:AcrR family transcriptional regulator